ncbi:MAG: DUF445 family protein [Chitinophagales bacterium]|nr:DUF445 family protein [Chitinophagales bacterium]
MFLAIDVATIKFWLIPIIGAFIGWITNWLAIKMLFHPRKPIDLKVFTLHGVFPKNKKNIATNLGKIVQKDLISFDDIKNRLQEPESMANFKDEISVHVERIIREKVESMTIAKVFISENFIQNLHQMAVEEIEMALPGVIEKYINKIEEKVDIQEMVFEKVNNFSDEKLENLLLAITNKEFKFIEIVGAVLGFLIGIIQMLLSGVNI